MTERDSRKQPPEKIGNGKYAFDKKLGAGCFGEVCRYIDSSTKEWVAVKFEPSEGHNHQLMHEVDILKQLAQGAEPPQGFAQLFYSGREAKHNCMVMELLGRSLEDRFQGEKQKFSAGTTALIAEQVMHRIEYLHSKGIIHRDIKPENFMFGIKGKIHHIYLIDFGLSKNYWDYKTNSHVRLRQGLNLTGTARYASINAHKGFEQSRRDDMEAIGHMIAYFLRGSLPWSGLDAKTQEHKYRKIKEKKESTGLDELFGGHPEPFKNYLEDSRRLDFKDRPNYVFYRELFRSVLAKQTPKLEDHSFPWLLKKELDPLEALVHPQSLRHPDVVAPPAQKKQNWWACCGSSPKVKD